MQNTYICDLCPVRKRAEENPNTMLARMWRLHTRFCPMYNSYLVAKGEKAPVERDGPHPAVIAGAAVVGLALLRRRRKKHEDN